VVHNKIKSKFLRTKTFTPEGNLNLLVIYFNFLHSYNWHCFPVGVSMSIWTCTQRCSSQTHRNLSIHHLVGATVAQSHPGAASPSIGLWHLVSTLIRMPAILSYSMEHMLLSTTVSTYVQAC